MIVPLSLPLSFFPFFPVTLPVGPENESSVNCQGRYKVEAMGAGRVCSLCAGGEENLKMAGTP